MDDQTMTDRLSLDDLRAAVTAAEAEYKAAQEAASEARWRELSASLRFGAARVALVGREFADAGFVVGETRLRSTGYRPWLGVYSGIRGVSWADACAEVRMLKKDGTPGKRTELLYGTPAEIMQRYGEAKT